MARKQGSHSGTTGPKVHETALRLIARHGFAAVSMRQIAAELGLQAGALYNYTEDKQSLLFDLMYNHMDDLLTALKNAPIAGDAMAQLQAFTRFHIRFHLPRSDQVFISYMELRNLSPENFQKIERMRREYEDFLGEILELGEVEGVFEIQDRKVATMALLGMLTGLSQWYREDGRLAIDRIETFYWDLVRKSVSPAKAPIAIVS